MQTYRVKFRQQNVNGIVVFFLINSSICEMITFIFDVFLCVPAVSETAGRGCDEHFGTLWPARTAESEPTAAAASSWHHPLALNQSGIQGRIWWSSGSPFQR